MPLRQRSPSLLRATDAVIAVELALLAPLIIGVLLVSLGFARVMLMNTLIYDAALEASRYGATGNGGSARTSNINAIVAAITGVDGSVTMTPYLTWSSLASATPDTAQSGTPGQPGEVVVYTVTYSDRLAGNLLGFIPMLRRASTTTTAYQLSQTMVVQNEPNFSTN